MGDRDRRAAAVCIFLVTTLVEGGRAGASWRDAEGAEVPFFECDFESDSCLLWSDVTTPETCNGLDDNCDTVADEDASCAGALSCCGTGGCVDVMTNPDHCGDCDQPCALPDHGLPACVFGTCGIGSCDKGFDDCDEQAFNGCETDLNSNPDHCSQCDLACPLPDHGLAACSSGTCGVGSCDKGFDDCDGQVFNGCEADLNTDVDTCGDCFTTCAVEETCDNGICQTP